MQKLTGSLARMLAVLMLGLAALPVAAQQGLFAPAVIVNDKVITGYEVQQRQRMMEVFNIPGASERAALDLLIDDRLRVQAAEAAGIRPAPEEVRDGMAEFASRAELSLDAFIKVLAANGVAEETYRDFVLAGLSWRLLVQQRFVGRASVSEAEIDRAMSGTGGGSNVRVLLSEIIMPAPAQRQAEVQERARRISQLTSTSAFSAEARRYSATATRGNGGRLPWRDLSELPPVLQPLVLALKPGEVTDPLPIPGAIALFQLRDIEETGYAAPEIAAVEYAAYYMPGGRSKETLAAARVLARKVDRCDDLYGVAKGQPAEVLERGTLPPSDIPTDIAFELSKLDPGEVSTALTRANGQTLVFLMLCGRTVKAGEGDGAADREQISTGLRNRRLEAMAEGYLAQLRADARIIER